MDKDFECAISLLPEELRACKNCLKNSTNNVTEIRIRSGKAISFTELGRQIQSKLVTDAKTVENIFVRLCGNSVFAHQEDIKNGYISLDNGIRVGICGSAVLDDIGIKNISQITGLNIRVARYIKGASRQILPYIIQEERIRNTLVFGPPLSGKTTVLRDLICQLSDLGKKVAVIDERRELSVVRDACIYADFFVGYPRKTGIEQAIRCFSPDVIIFDELGNGDDIDGLFAAIDTGVAIITTAHGESIEALKRRKLLKSAMDEKIFDLAVQLGTDENIGKIEDYFILNEGCVCL